jgi:hypothetical protein
MSTSKTTALDPFSDHNPIEFVFKLPKEKDAIKVAAGFRVNKNYEITKDIDGNIIHPKRILYKQLQSKYIHNCDNDPHLCACWTCRLLHGDHVKKKDLLKHYSRLTSGINRCLNESVGRKNRKTLSKR